MRVQCTPEYQAEGRPSCGRWFDDVNQWTFCPHDRFPISADALRLLEGQRRDMVDRLVTLAVDTAKWLEVPVEVTLEMLRARLTGDHEPVQIVHPSPDCPEGCGEAVQVVTISQDGLTVWWRCCKCDHRWHTVSRRAA